MSKLLPVKNYRRVIPHVCMFCRYMALDIECGDTENSRDSSAFTCRRPGGPEIDGADLDGMYARTCDGWASQDAQK